jgi:hypothetical protein
VGFILSVCWKIKYSSLTACWYTPIYESSVCVLLCMWFLFWGPSSIYMLYPHHMQFIPPTVPHSWLILEVRAWSPTQKLECVCWVGRVKTGNLIPYLNVYMAFLCYYNILTLLNNQKRRVTMPAIKNTYSGSQLPFFLQWVFNLHVFTLSDFPQRQLLHKSRYTCIYEGCLKSSWTGGSTLLLCRGRQWLLCQVVVVWSSSL